MRHFGFAERRCEICGAGFRVRVSHMKWTPYRFCSSACRHAGLRGKKTGTAPRDEMVRLYRDEGLTLSEVGERLGYTLLAVRYHLRKAGVARRPPTGANLNWPENRARQRATTLRGPAHPHFRDLPMAELVEAYLNGAGCTSLAARYGVGSTTITRRLRQAGIAIRAPGFGRSQQAADGHVVQSGWERLVDDWLSAHGIDHAVGPSIPFQTDHRRADFFARGHYIEVWGVEGHAWYANRRADKIAHCQRHGLPLLELTPADIHRGDFSALGVLLDTD